MDFMILAQQSSTGFWQSIIGWFNSFIGSYGWTFIVFSICLKLVLSPLDFYQKFSMRKTQKQQALLKPELDRIKDKYGNNKELVNQKTMELYRKNKVSPASGCLPMVIYLAVTLVTFFTLFGAINSMSRVNITNEYDTLRNTYITNYIEYKSNFELDKTIDSTVKVTIEGVEYNYYELEQKAKEEFNTNKNSEGKYIIGDVTFENENDFATAFIDTSLKTIAQDQVLAKYNDIKEGWLWIKNIYRPDNYSSPFPNFKDYISMTGNTFAEKTIEGTEQKYYYQSFDVNAEGSTDGYYYVTDNAEFNKETLKKAQVQAEIDFNNVTNSVRQEYGSWNGYFILILLAGLATLLGQLLANAGAKTKAKNGEEVKIPAQTNKIMLVVMPLIMIWFSWSYSALLALYIVVNSLMSILIGYLCNLISNAIESKQKDKELVKVSLKGKEERINKTINTTQSAHDDYRIEKRGRIIYSNDTKSESKKSKKDDAKKGE